MDRVLWGRRRTRLRSLRVVKLAAEERFVGWRGEGDWGDWDGEEQRLVTSEDASVRSDSDRRIGTGVEEVKKR